MLQNHVNQFEVSCGEFVMAFKLACVISIVSSQAD